MSAIKRGVRKVFRGVKSAVKKVPKPLLIAGGVLLTGGLAAGGFAAFSGASGIGGFFGAVGQTMAAGAQAIAGSLGVGSGITGTGMTAAFSGQAGATLGTGVLAQSLGLAATPAQAQAANALTNTARTLGAKVPFSGLAGASSQAPSGFMGTIGNMIRGFTGSTAGQLAIAQGIMGGLQSYAQGRENRRQEKRFDTESVWGTQRRGGDGSSDMPEIDLPRFTPNRTNPPTADEWRSRQPQYNQPENMAFNRPLIQQNRDVPGMLEEDDEWFQPTVPNQQGIMYG